MKNSDARRKQLFHSGCWLFALDIVLYAAAELRTPHIDPTSPEFFIYPFGGFLLTLVAIVLIFFGSGWKRVAALVSALVVAYLWISYIAFQTMVH
ncbi:MAG TPA: hypothetical protein VHY48_08350 [Acidobacteriaceae bacterium]|nr:hypothetical protein [Acidobacteriaceae bacterium]